MKTDRYFRNALRGQCSAIAEEYAEYSGQRKLTPVITLNCSEIIDLLDDADRGAELERRNTVELEAALREVDEIRHELKALRPALFNCDGWETADRLIDRLKKPCMVVYK